MPEYAIDRVDASPPMLDLLRADAARWRAKAAQLDRMERLGACQSFLDEERKGLARTLNVLVRRMLGRGDTQRAHDLEAAARKHGL